MNASFRKPRKFGFADYKSRILEIGCGEGGNLVPFARIGCRVTGIDLSENRIRQARQFFQEERLPATFIASDIFQIIQLEEAFDIILIHDVIEHISEKYRLLEHIKRFLTPGGLLFISFPPWQMPFGGHQQICRNKYVSRLPFIHLLPAGIYSSLLHHFGESQARIDELLDIRKCRTSIELFEKLLCTSHYRIFHKQFWFINPHYEQKFHLKPRKLPRLIGSIPHLRNFFCTSCFYLIQS